MSQKTIISITWIASVAAAFAVGYVVKSDPSATVSSTDASGRTVLATTASGNTITEKASKQGASSNSNARSAAGTPSLEGLSSEALQEVVKNVVNLNDPIERDRQFLELLKQLTPENAQDFAEAARAGGRRFGFGGGNRDKLGLVLNAWAKLDGAAAMEYATAEREGEGRGGRGGRGDWGGGESFSALSGWATTDPDGAKAWLDGQEDGRTKGFLTAALIEGLITTDPDSAMNYISNLPADDEGRGRYTSMIASEKLEQGLQSALSWFDSISDPELKSGAAFRIAMDYGREDPAAAAAWAVDSGSDRTLGMVAGNYARANLDASLDWALTLDGENQSAAMGAIFDRWADDDALAASEFLVTMKDGTAKDSAVRSLANELSREDPQSALTWASSIGESKLRNDTIEPLARRWLRSDESAATAWLTEANLPDETLENILVPDEGDERRGWDRGGFGGGRGGRGGR